jgi:divinyl chlorophyllide a 8-vinyl-reductase
LLNTIIFGLDGFNMLLPALADKAALARIGRYYATESMLVWDATRQRYDAEATPSFGSQTLFDHYDRLIAGDKTVDLGEHAVF